MTEIDYNINISIRLKIIFNTTFFLIDQELCSHLRSVCYLAESIFPELVRYGTKCKRRNMMIDDDPKGILDRIGNAHFMPVGQPTPTGALGIYCISNIEAPFCSNEKNKIGSMYCCKPSQSVIVPPLTGRRIEDINMKDLQLLT